jgi:hypothetical protein
MVVVQAHLPPSKNSKTGFGGRNVVSGPWYVITLTLIVVVTHLLLKRALEVHDMREWYIVGLQKRLHGISIYDVSRPPLFSVDQKNY